MISKDKILTQVKYALIMKLIRIIEECEEATSDKRLNILTELILITSIHSLQIDNMLVTFQHNVVTLSIQGIWV